MKRFNMKTLSLITSLSSLALLMACDDSITNNDPVTTQAYASQAEFPECEESGEGYFALVSSSKDLYICTASEWVNISKAGSSAKPGCSSEELENGKGVKIICNGDSVAVLNYGKQGKEGDKGDDGHKGPDGDKGQPGSSSNGKDAVWDTDRCKLKNSGFDVMVYDCGDSVYVRDLPTTGNYNTTNIWRPWPSASVKYGSSTLYTIYNNQFESNATGSLKRYEGDTWGSSSYSVSLSAADLLRDDYQIKGTAKVKVTTAQTITADKYRPFVGVKATFSNTNFKSRLGLCLTYSSEKDMALLVEGKTGFLKASVPATKGMEKIVNVVWDDFEPVAEGVDADTVIRYVKGVYVEAVGGEEAGTYENEFSILQMGDFGNCDEATYANSAWKAQIESITEPGANVTYGGVTYKTVKIGSQTWLAQNLRYVTTNSQCFDPENDDASCTKYGRAYQWADAINNANCSNTTTCSPALSGTIRGICPSGWHLPTHNEWKTLKNAVEIEELKDNSVADILALVGTENSNYLDYGKNLTGFNLHIPNSNFHYWNPSEYSTTNGYGTNIWTGYIYPSVEHPVKTAYKPVRCVKD